MRLRCVWSAGWLAMSACRIIAGIGVGGSIPSVFTLYMEYLPVKGRGGMISIVATFWMVGSIYAAGVCRAIAFTAVVLAPCL